MGSRARPFSCRYWDLAAYDVAHRARQELEPDVFLQGRLLKSPGKEEKMATDYDDLRPDVKEAQEQSLEAAQSVKGPNALSAVQDVEETDDFDGIGPGGEIVAEELIINVVPQGHDEFTCYSCFLVRHRSQIANERDGHPICTECAAA